MNLKWNNTQLLLIIYAKLFPEKNHDFNHNLLISEEAHIQLNGFVNISKTVGYGGYGDNPKTVPEQQLHPLNCIPFGAVYIVR